MDRSFPISTFFRCLLCFLLVIGGASQGVAQKTKVHGKVTNAKTGEPIPFVNVSFKDSKIGTTTDMEGKYSMETYYATDSLLFSNVGFKRQIVSVQKDVDQRIDVELMPTSVNLEEVEIKPDKDRENPAHPILRNVIRYKDVNDREKLKAYEYEVYNKVEFDLNNISEKMQDRRIFKPFKFVFDNIDSTGEKPFLPIFMTESISRYYFKRDPKNKKEIIKATKVSGVKNQSVSQFLGDMYQNVNIYDNYINIFEKNFVSPIADFGFTFYKYYLMDSLYVDSSYCYKIRFLPKRKKDLTFRGDMYINDTTYAVKKIEASIAEDANINFINSLNVTQTYEQVKDEVWMLKKDRLLIDFNLSDKTMGLYGRKTTSYKDFLINQPRKEKFYSGAKDVILADSVNDRDDGYWKKNRHDTLSDQEEQVYSMVDTMKTIPQYRTYVDIISMAITGYLEWDYLELGPYFTTYSYNPVEGHRFRLGARTSNKFSKRLMLEGYGAYGLNDERFKYGGSFKYFLNKQPRQAIGGEYSLDVEQLGQSPNAFREDNILASFLRRNPATKLSLVEEYKGYFMHEWFQGFSNKVIFRKRSMRPLGELVSTDDGSSSGWGNGVNSINTMDVGLYLRFAYKEKYVEGEFERVSLGTDYPVLETQYTYSDPNFLPTDHAYQKLRVRVDHDLPLGAFGNLEYRLEGGKIWGKLPYPLLEIHDGNATYFYDSQAFNMMNLFEFVSDEYFKWSFSHHWNGFFFNRVPLFRRLNFREVVTTKGVIGGLSDKHKKELSLLDEMSPLSKPYIEFGVGVENILKIIRVDGIWRLSYLNKEDVSDFGIRGTLQVKF